MSEIKMSDVFKLPLNGTYDYLQDANGNEVACFDITIQDESAAHAINSHDALVEQNKALNEVINEIRAMVTDVQDGFDVTGGDAEILDLINAHWSKHNESEDISRP